MVAPVGSNSATPGLKIDLNKVDLGPLQVAGQSGQNPAATGMDEFLYGKPKKHTLRNWIIGLLVAAGVVVGGAKAGVKWIKPEATGSIMSKLRKGSETVSKLADDAWGKVKETYSKLKKKVTKADKSKNNAPKHEPGYGLIDEAQAAREEKRILKQRGLK